MWVDYNGSVLEVRVSNTGVRPAAPTIALAIDIPATLGSDAAFVGFTAATGAAVGEHDIVSWTLDGQCRNVAIGTCSTGVLDFVVPGNGLLSEQIGACAIEATTHGEFVACVAASRMPHTRMDSSPAGRRAPSRAVPPGALLHRPGEDRRVHRQRRFRNRRHDRVDPDHDWIWRMDPQRWDLRPAWPRAAAAANRGSRDLVSDQSGGNLNRAMQKLSVPLDVRAATLTWSDRVRSYAPLLDPGQEYRVVIRNAFDLTPLVEVFSTNAGDLALQQGPNLRSFDLTTALQALKGQTVFLSFEQQAQTNFFTLTLDDASLVMSPGEHDRRPPRPGHGEPGRCLRDLSSESGSVQDSRDAFRCLLPAAHTAFADHCVATRQSSARMDQSA